jgi:hypothetical protein
MLISTLGGARLGQPLDEVTSGVATVARYP